MSGNDIKGIFRGEALRPIRDDMTISRNSHFFSSLPYSWFSLGKDTDISQEAYDTYVIYLGCSGTTTFVLGKDAIKKDVCAGDMLVASPKTLCGMETSTGCVYTEMIILNKEITMNKAVKTNEVLELKNLISYEEGSIANLDIAHADNFKYVLMAFDEGTGLTPHRAPGNAVLTALEGEAVIGYEGTDYPIKAGESFRFDKDGLHSVTAKGKFKMSLLLVIE